MVNEGLSAEVGRKTLKAVVRTVKVIMKRCMIMKYGLVLLGVVLLAGCATGHHRLYSGKNIEPDEIVIVKGGDPLDLYTIDGKPGPNFGGVGRPRRYNSGWDGSFSVELPPGKHVFTVGYLYLFRGEVTSSAEPQTVVLEAEPGAVYRFNANYPGYNWEPTIQRIK